jgi:hypothetical protein
LLLQDFQQPEAIDDHDDQDDIPLPELQVNDESSSSLANTNIDGLQTIHLSELDQCGVRVVEAAPMNDGTHEGPGYNFDQEFHRQGAKRRTCGWSQNLWAYLFSRVLLRK